MKELIRRCPFVAAVLMLIAHTTTPPSGSTFLTADSPQPSSDSARLKLAESYGKLPLSFEANRGQTDKRVRFFSRGKGYSLFLTDAEAVLTLVGPEESGRAGSVLHMKLLGANRNTQAVGLEELSGRSNYFIGSDPKKWRTDVPNYRKVRFASVYPGVDLVYYGNQRQLEYDFIVRPGADPSDITLGFTGAQRLDIRPDGDLALQTRAGEVCWQKPVIYQDVDGVRRMVDGHYVRKDKQTIGFAVGAYDAQHPLVIDPVLVYATYLGGSGHDLAYDIAVDSSGNVYITGETGSTDFPTASPLQAVKSGDGDVFVTKLNASASALLYSSYLGGSLNEGSPSIALDASGNAYLTGFTLSADFPTVNPIQPPRVGVTSDAFVAKLDASGSSLVYSTHLGGTGGDVGWGIAVDSSDNAYVAGSTSSTDFPTASPFQAVRGGQTDAFVSKLNAAGSALVYSTYLGGSASDEALAIAVDSSGTYVAGDTNSTNFPLARPLQAVLGGGVDAFVSKLNPDGGALLYSTYLGGSDFDAGSDIAVDSAGSPHLTGHTRSINFPTAGAVQAALAGGQDAFVTQLNASGSALVVSTYLGGSLNEFAWGIAVDSLGNAYVTGQSASIDFPTADPIQGASGGSSDAFVTKLDVAGSTVVYSSYLGGSGFDVGNGIAVDFSGNAYVTGAAGSIDFPTASPFRGASGGGFDGFVAKIGTAIPIRPPQIVKAFGASSILLGASTTLTFGIENPNATPLTGVGFTDSLPVGMIVATPNGLTGSCGGIVTAIAGSSSIALSAGTMGGSSSCSFSVTIVGTSLGVWTNTTGNVASTEGGSGGTASANLSVLSPFPNCHGQTISDLAHSYRGLHNAAVSLGFPSVKALQDSIRARCGF